MTLKAKERFINQNKHCFPPQNFIGNTWSLSSREGEGRLPPRTLQATAYDPESDRLFIHGGFDLNKALSDTWTFSFKANQWTKLPENPSQRLGSTGLNLAKEALLVGSGDISGNNSVDFRFTRVNQTTVAMKVIPDRPIIGKDSQLRRRRRSPMLPEILLEHERRSQEDEQHNFQGFQSSS